VTYLTLQKWHFVVMRVVCDISTGGSIISQKTWMRSKHRLESLKYHHKLYSDGCGYKNYCVLVYDTVYSGKYLRTFQKSRWIHKRNRRLYEQNSWAIREFAGIGFCNKQSCAILQTCIGSYYNFVSILFICYWFWEFRWLAHRRPMRVCVVFGRRSLHVSILDVTKYTCVYTCRRTSVIVPNFTNSLLKKVFANALVQLWNVCSASFSALF
jgi:hypothetical protein